MSHSRATITAVLAVVLVTPRLMAVKSAIWTHEQPKDFVAGQLDDVVISSLGEVTLGRKVRTLLESEASEEIVNALARAGDGKLYAATGPNGVIYRIDGADVTPFATLPEGGTVLSLLFARDGRLLAGTGGGDQATIYSIDGTGRASVLHRPQGATYIWAMVRGADGEVYAATGIEGKLYRISPDGGACEVVADLKPKNLLCLAIGPDGILYTGTDEDGLVYRVDPAGGGPFVMYDATQPEISAIVLDAQGNVYASTADASAARPGRAVADKPAGKPDQRPADTGEATRPAGDKPVEASDQEPADEPADNGDESAPAASRPSAAATQPAARRAASSTKTDGGGNGQPDKSATRPARAVVVRTVGRPVSGSGKEGGNVIYRIDPDGFVTEVFREPVVILSMAEAQGTLYVGTGNEGRVYAITPAAERGVMLAKLEAAQATALLRLPDGRLVVGSANPPLLVEIEDAFADKGTLESEPLDAGQIVKWGRISWNAAVPTGTKLTIATRSSNVQDTESDAWDEWSAELDATRPQQIPSVNARFLQYRLTFETTVPDTSPTVRKVEIARIEENRAPHIMSIETASALEESKKPGSPPQVKMAAGTMGADGDDPIAQHNWVVKWKAEDPNEDSLIFSLFFREHGGTRWIRLVKEEKEALYIWDTRTVSDGKYEMRVVATDRPGNPPAWALTASRISEPVLVDNTPPDVTIQTLTQKGADALTVEASLEDTLSSIAGADYCINSADEWIALAADDDIFDSFSETISFTVDDLKPGEHRLAIRVYDAQGNTRHVTRRVQIGNGP